jgi:diguanylate cyclase (GGDEF)-like protein
MCARRSVDSTPAAPRQIAVDLLDVGLLHTELVTQRNRALTYVLGGLAVALTTSSGLLHIEVTLLVAVLAVGFLSVALVCLLWRRAEKAGRRIHFAPWWISCDVILITGLIGLSGGLRSPWFVWYLGTAGAAVAHCGRRFIVGIGLATGGLYIGLLVAMGDIAGFDRHLFSAVAQLLSVLGASLFLLLSTYKLRLLSISNHRLRQEADGQVEKLTQVTKELESMTARWRGVSELDPLTGLHNRRYFNDRVIRETERHQKERRAGSRSAGLILLDLDGFKGINDTEGHAGGDGALQHFARLLQGCVRVDDDWLVRWGGDEFLILLPNTDEESARRVAERIVTTVASHLFEVAPGREIQLSSSVGWVMFEWGVGPDGTPNWESALALADAALYLAKREGRGRCRTLRTDLLGGPSEAARLAALVH